MFVGQSPPLGQQRGNLHIEPFTELLPDIFVFCPERLQAYEGSEFWIDLPAGIAQQPAIVVGGGHEAALVRARPRHRKGQLAGADAHDVVDAEDAAGLEALVAAFLRCTDL